MHKAKQACLLSFHDVGIHNFDIVDSLIDEILFLAGTPFALLVIPNTKGETAERISAFKMQLIAWQQDGFELLLHGCYHGVRSDSNRSYPGRLALRLTNNEAEFSGLNEASSAALLEEALSFWETLEIGPPTVFVPPTWHSNPFLVSQVLDRSMLYEGRFWIQNKNKKYFSGVISFAGLPKIAIPATFAYAKSLLNTPVGIPRLALHPSDFPDHRKDINHLIRLALNKRRWIQYASL